MEMHYLLERKKLCKENDSVFFIASVGILIAFSDSVNLHASTSFHNRDGWGQSR